MAKIVDIILGILDVLISFGSLSLVVIIPITTLFLFLIFLILTLCFRKNKVAFTIFLLLALICFTITLVTGFSILLICFTFFLIISGM